ncbi:MAG: DUF1543 domain-containing protein [Candidatus Moraniibacteriota bacterium]|jgi:uncharacterized protein DUF1543
MKLFVGFLGKALTGNIVEEHKLEFVVAEDVDKAKEKLLNKWSEEHVHVDGLKDISEVDDYKIILK